MPSAKSVTNSPVIWLMMPSPMLASASARRLYYASANDGELERDQRQEYRRGQHDDLRAGERQTSMPFSGCSRITSIGQTASTRPASGAAHDDVMRSRCRLTVGRSNRGSSHNCLAQRQQSMPRRVCARMPRSSPPLTNSRPAIAMRQARVDRATCGRHRRPRARCRRSSPGSDEERVLERPARRCGVVVNVIAVHEDVAAGLQFAVQAAGLPARRCRCRRR